MNSHNSSTISVIYDTDMDLDCDDAGALAIVHALMDNGEANLLGVICDVPLDSSLKCAFAINKYYHRAELPIGYLMKEDFKNGTRFKEYREHQKKIIATSERNYYPEKLVEHYNLKNVDIPNLWDAVSLYRRLLSNSVDNSVIIIAVGLLSVLSDLLDSGPDEISSLSGKVLIKKKVKKLVTMGWGRFPQDMERLNWRMDWKAARNVIHFWPTQIIVQTHGDEFLNGKTLYKTPSSNPVRKCYDLYLTPHHKGNFSWDLLTSYYAIRGCDQYFEEVNGYRLILDKEPGKNHWVADDTQKPPHKFLKIISPRMKFKKEVEELLTKLPERR